MWGDPDPDPGGHNPTTVGPTPQELSDLKDQNEQHLLLIAQLKEMLRKEQSSVTQEKVEEYVNTLSKAKAKRSRQKKDGSGASNSGNTISSVNIDANKKERINLLRQQLEENKAKLAERGKNQKGIEEMVTQLQAQFKDSQQIIGSTPLNMSLSSEPKPLDYSENTPQKELYNILITKEKKITELLNKSQKLESTVFDLQENLKEKDSVIDARTKAITLMTDSLSKKGKSTLETLDETKEQMRAMQERFVTLEGEMKARQLLLLNDLKMKNLEISDLKEINSQLEVDKAELVSKILGVDEDRPRAESFNSEMERLKEDLQKNIKENESLCEKIKDLEGGLPQKINYEELQEKLTGSVQENADSLSKISQLELQLEEALTKLHQEKVDSSNDLKHNLEEENKRLCEVNSQNLSKIADLENKLEEAYSDLKLLKSTGMGGKTVQDDENEIAKLKKQLDESNKNMIKMRAQQKGKIKELNKKLDQFKKMGDANTLILQLQNDVSKLNEKIAELEDEKGNLQLKMVESTGSSKDSSELEDHIKDLAEKLSNTVQDLEDKDKVIEILESEVLSLKEDLKQKSEEISSQVSNEMTSIQFEEQIENIESEKRKLIEELVAVKAENDDLLERMEIIKKEKQEVVAKLDNYIQENMELIDKLEKLSTEKVSSAESIEIVEGLTQQEKLELAAYQKHVNPEDQLKCSEEYNLEPPAELNESVLQLSEDTAELLQKIEMFTQERKEVMQKMEALKEENNTLNVKVKEIENNRDILVETYEQLQNEKEVLLEKIENLQHQNKNEKKEDDSAEALEGRLKELQSKCEDLVEENNELKRTLKDFDAKMQEKYDLETQLRKVSNSNENLDSKLKANLEEINTYQLTIEENKNELINSSGLVGQLQEKLADREKDIQELNAAIQDLNAVINELQSKNSNYESMEDELEELKSALSGQLQDTRDYESEMNQNSELIGNLKQELVGMNRRILESEHELEVKEVEIQKLRKDIGNKEEIIRNLQESIEEKDKKFRMVSEEIKEKYLGLQKQLDANGDSLQKQINELTNKNKEQLEKMKKIAANLKKKTQAYHDLEAEYNGAKGKWENEVKEKENDLWMAEERVAALVKEVKELDNRLSNANTEKEGTRKEANNIRERLQALEQTNVDLQNYVLELKQKEDKLNEVSLQQEMSASLHEEINSGFPKVVHEEKITELEMLLESKESELCHYKERVENLEESIRKFEEEKAVLEAKNGELLEKLSLTSNSFKEKAMLEDQLELKLAEISANDEALTKKLQDTVKEHEDLTQKYKENEDIVKRLKIKLKKAHDKVTELKGFQVSMQELENANQELRSQVAALESHQRQLQNENELLQRRNVLDYEKIEADYQIQLEELLKIRNDLTVEGEKLQERVKELEEKELELGTELDEYRLRLEQSENTNLAEINGLNEELKKTREELDAEKSEMKKLGSELMLTKEKLGNSLSEVEGVNERLSVTSELLESSRLENQKLSDEVRVVNDKLNNSLSEVENLSYQLNFANEKLQSAVLELQMLNTEMERLKKEIVALQNAKSQMEVALNEASQKLKIDSSKVVEQVLPKTVQDSQGYVPTFHWPGQEQSQAVEIFDSIGDQSQWFDQSTQDQTQPQAVQTFDLFGASSSEPNPLFNQGPHNTATSQAQPFSPIVENNRESLLKKIKALEFLLYNVDKEKEIALDQCSEMVNELTQLIYDQTASTPQVQPPPADLEAQIMSKVDIEQAASNKKELEKIEYSPTKEACGEQAAPVSENVIEPKKAYLCFNDDDPAKKKLCPGIEAQVVSERDVAVAGASKKQLQKLEYEQVNKSLGEQMQPVVEPLAKAKQAYLCYTKEDKPQSLEAYEENDDGWGWGPEEARLEEEHISNVENIPQMKSLLLEIQQLKENQRVLQVERENHLEEIKQLQIKSGKLIKKCKELKAKNDQASSSKKQEDGGFFDLNETIQDELKVQVQRLEKTVKETSVELDKEKAEKSRLLKRVDVLTSANERMMEMKEIQDTEVLRWQRKHQEAVEKLQETEWGNDGLGDRRKEKEQSFGSVDSNRVQELENTIKDLTLDNEELQTLLEEQTALRVEAEKGRSLESGQEAAELRELNQKVNREVEELRAKDFELSTVQGDLKVVLDERELLVKRKCELEMVIDSKENRIKALEEMMLGGNGPQQRNLNELENEVLVLNNQMISQKGILQEKDLIITDLLSTLQQVNDKKVELEQSVKQFQNEVNVKVQVIENMQANIDSYSAVGVEIQNLRAVIDQLTVGIREKEQIINDLNLELNKLKNEKGFWECTEAQLMGNVMDKDEENRKLIHEKKKADLKLQYLMEELQSKSTEIEDFQRLTGELQDRVRDIDEQEKFRKDETNQKLLLNLQNQGQEIEDQHKLLEELRLKAKESGEYSTENQRLVGELDLKIQEVQDLSADKLCKDSEIERLLKELQNKEQELDKRNNEVISELNEKWQIQVDQRGVDVAESWKMHLEAVEKEYAAVQEKLKSDITELEEKCNILVNENNELRKNVDAEIRNEVDKMSALQQQISTHQQTINSLNLALKEKDKQIEEIQNNLSNYVSLEIELEALRTENAENNKRLAGIDILIETTQKQFDEKRQVVEEIVSILEKNAPSPISYEKQDVLYEFQRQLGSAGQRDEEVLRLSQVISDLEKKLSLVAGQKDREIAGLNEVVEDLERELSQLHEKDAEIVRLSVELEKFEESKQTVQQELQKLQQEHSNCQLTVNDYKQKIEEYKTTHVVLQQTMEERNQLINQLNQQLLQIQENNMNDSNKEVENLNIVLSNTKEDYLALQAGLSECQTQLYEASQQLTKKSQELDTVTQQLTQKNLELQAVSQQLTKKTQELELGNQQLANYQQHYGLLQEENSRLKITLDERDREYNSALETLQNNQLTDIQRHYDELLSAKNLDNQTLHAQVQELLKANQEYNERLSQEISSKQDVEGRLLEQTKLVDDDTKQLEELKLIIEEQVVKIEELKNVLFDKSNQYDSLIAEMDLSRQPVTQQPSAAALTAQPQKQHYEEDDLTEPVSRAELDLALYMLHQRDVRCEELTVELTQLLEERDTLQLRLSNAIREKEELRRKMSADLPHPASSDQANTPPRSKSATSVGWTTELAKHPLESDQNLAVKLSELKNVGYKKDKTFVDEQEARRFQQLAIMQQHINDASKLPPEAAAKLVDASYTLSRDVQSPSKVLLNWLWGNNPPKASDS